MTSPTPTPERKKKPESRLRNTEPQALDYYDYTGEAGLTHYVREMYPDHDKGVEVDMVLAKDANLLIKSKLSQEREDLVGEVEGLRAVVLEPKSWDNEIDRKNRYENRLYNSALDSVLALIRGNKEIK